MIIRPYYTVQSRWPGLTDWTLARKRFNEPLYADEYSYSAVFEGHDVRVVEVGSTGIVTVISERLQKAAAS